MKASFLVFIAVMGLFALTIQGCNGASEEKKTEQVEEKAHYQCPMDCEKGKTYEKEGQCPVCGMELEKAPVQS